MLKIIATCAAVSLSASSAAGSELIPKLGSGELITIDKAQEFLNDRYQLGSEWGKKRVKAADFAEIPTLQSIAEGTVKIGGATGFYLGQYSGEHLVATNNHVCPSASRCERGSVNFTMQRKRIPLKKLLGTFPSIDLAIVSIAAGPTDAAFLAAVKNPFAFDTKLYPGQELITVGYGSANNTWRQLMGNWDSDCKVFSGEGEYRLMKDPDSLNPGQYETWSFANGCDVSHGDSGSAMVDRGSGGVVGIIWTGRIPKDPKVQDSGYLDELLATPSEDTWTQLSYGVPAAKILEKLESEVAGETTNELTRSVFTAIINGDLDN